MQEQREQPQKSNDKQGKTRKSNEVIEKKAKARKAVRSTSIKNPQTQQTKSLKNCPPKENVKKCSVRNVCLVDGCKFLSQDACTPKICAHNVHMFQTLKKDEKGSQ